MAGDEDSWYSNLSSGEGISDMTSEDDNSSLGDRRVTSVTTSDEFHEALQKLVTEAAMHGVDVRGGWPVAGESRDTAWGVEITRIAGRTRTDTGEFTNLVHAIVETVADREGIKPTDLPPIYDDIDPDVLELHTQSATDDGTIHFQYSGYQVTVRGDGTIFVDK